MKSRDDNRNTKVTGGGTRTKVLAVNSMRGVGGPHSILPKSDEGPPCEDDKKSLRTM